MSRFLHPLLKRRVKASCFSITIGGAAISGDQTHLRDWIFAQSARLTETTPANVRPDENRSPDSLKAVMEHDVTWQNKNNSL